MTLSGGPAGATVRVYKISSAGRLSFIGDGPEVAATPAARTSRA